MGIAKKIWLKQRGYKPITDKVIREWMGERILWKNADGQFEQARQQFTHYKRYGEKIIPYSKEYLSLISLDELKVNNWRNIKRFIIDEMVYRHLHPFCIGFAIGFLITYLVLL